MRNLAKSKSIQAVAAAKGAGGGGRRQWGAMFVKFLRCTAVFQTKVQRSHLNPNPEVGSTPFNLWASSNHHSQPLAPLTALAAAAPAAAAPKWEIHFLFKFWRKTAESVPRVPTQSHCCCWVFQWRFRREEDECCATDNTMTPIVFQLSALPVCWFCTKIMEKKKTVCFRNFCQSLSYLRLRTAFEKLLKNCRKMGSLRN